ncbi:endonuclease/exonuclease/phosphatase family protein [Fulvivirga ligni]|uniref:endonuclease/exonuclease/phosphatase family protein n=1 Tax=Fulvivirga ligni TaxID=2904246 RepID=UPI001F33F963|nr:endonuclease/exonuclease/phosphatase family protein [Fulvivirga ligni]UII23839.1 endonuclease/exonuclease/phosphatase family protein [Fulvivirga ligni]
MKKAFRILFSLAAIIVCLATFLSFFGSMIWQLDLFTNFKLQYALSLLLCVIVLSFTNGKRMAIIAGIFLISNAIAVLPHTSKLSSNGANTHLKITSINLLKSNHNYQATINFINTENPDVLVFEEYQKHWHDKLSVALVNYPYKQTVLRGDSFGIAIYSKEKPSSTTTLTLDQSEVPSLLCKFAVNGSEVNVLGTHTLPPTSEYYAVSRNQHLKSISELKIDSLVVIGDLNITPYSSYFKSMIENSDLEDTRNGFGIQASWPSWGWIFRIPLDHCLVSKNLAVADRTIGPYVGSDHYPITVTLAL